MKLHRAVQILSAIIGAEASAFVPRQLAPRSSPMMICRGTTRSSSPPDHSAEGNSNGQGENSADANSNANSNAASASSNLFADEDCLDLCEVDEVADEEAAAAVVQENELAPPKDTTPTRLPKKRAAPVDHETSRKNLELRWQVVASSDSCDLDDLNSCGGPCEECAGTGRCLCRFCSGTGFLTVGERVIGGGKACPICDEEGEEKCRSCRGSGWVAKWRQLNLTSGP